MNELIELQSLITDFTKTRNWEEFHTPKNLAMAIAGEAGELAAEFQWLTPDESAQNSLLAKKRLAIEMEMADVAIYLLRLADVLSIDLNSAVRTKIKANESR